MFGGEITGKRHAMLPRQNRKKPSGFFGFTRLNSRPDHLQMSFVPPLHAKPKKRHIIL